VVLFPKFLPAFFGFSAAERHSLLEYHAHFRVQAGSKLRVWFPEAGLTASSARKGQPTGKGAEFQGRKPKRNDQQKHQVRGRKRPAHVSCCTRLPTRILSPRAIPRASLVA